MKSVKLLFSLMVLFLVSSSFAQTLNDYVLETRGDTLVVKDDADFNGVNTLYSLMNADTVNVPAGRVYLLRNGGVYSFANNPTTPNTRKVTVMGEIQSSLKTSKSAAAPAIIQGSVYQGGNTTPGMTDAFDLLVKNVDIEIANSGGSEGWAFFGFSSPGARLEVNNCIIEHNLWTTIGGINSPNVRVFYKNNYLVNLSGHTCRRNGGVVDFNGSALIQDTLSVENCTHVNTQGTLYKSRAGYMVNRSIFNHNDFIDCAGYIFMNNGDVPNFSVTNNIFVNVQLQPFAPILVGIDVGEVDVDALPMGLINVRIDSAFTAGGASFYADKNLAYWDPSLSDIVSTVNSNNVNGVNNWVSQMIIMNSRTQDLFANKTLYPKLNNGTWINKLPAFKNTDVLFTTQLAVLKTFATATVDTTFSGSLDSWRQSGNPEADFYTYADWPIPIDLSYTDADLMTAGLGGFPIGDLNWFAGQTEAWEAQAPAEYQRIAGVLAGTIPLAVDAGSSVPQQFQVQQNYPNPFNPSTIISFTVPQAGNVTLKVYNMLGQEVATLVDGYKTAQTYNVNFNASSLSSGLYLYTVTYGNQSISRKMMLLK